MIETSVIHNGDCLDILKTLPDESVDCIVTSPPYYALRDYGTGKWVGGDPNCPHKRLSKYSEHTITGHKQEELAGNVGDAIYKTVCPLCGAIREDKQIGLEENPNDYIERLVEVFHEAKRVLKAEGTLWLNIGDSYWGSGSRGYDFTDKWSEASMVQSNSKGTTNLSNVPKLVGGSDYKNKDLIGIPWMLAFALRNDGWFLRQDIIWSKPNPMPESVKDRCTKSHEYIFLLTKSAHYYFDNKAIQEDAVSSVGNAQIRFCGSKYGDNQDTKYAIYSGEVWKPTEKRNKRDVWTIAVQPTKEAHFATFPEALVEPCILAGCPTGGIVLDPFAGSGTTLRVAEGLNRRWVGIELNPQYVSIAKRRVNNVQKSLF